MSAQEPTSVENPLAALQQVLAQGQQAGVPEMLPPLQEPVTEGEDLTEVLEELMGAVRAMASKAKSAEDTREQSELGKGALAFAQAYVIMHPEVLAPQGVTPDRMPQGGEGAPAGAGTTTGRPPQPTARRGSGQVKG